MEIPPLSTSEPDRELRDAGPDDTVTVSGHGRILLEYVSEPHDGHTYALTDQGWVLRMFYGSPWRTYYSVEPRSLPEQVASIRLAKHQRVTVDRWRGPVPDIERPGYIPDREVGVVATTKEKKAKKEATPKADAKPAARKLGARAKRLLEGGLDLSSARQKEVLAAADAIAEKRGDRFTRIWDIYSAAGVKMPDNIAAEKKEFDQTGKMPRSAQTKGTPPEKRGRGNAEEAAEGRSSSPPTTQSESQGSTPTASGESTQNGGARTEETQDETL